MTHQKLQHSSIMHYHWSFLEKKKKFFFVALLWSILCHVYDIGYCYDILVIFWQACLSLQNTLAIELFLDVIHIDNSEQ
ncbi:hypothetical protein Pint_33699 [Pistacia integerrima]|uniref:Uncharacterized protein n=1 Tax=Pistacia integerrima TaxID=434235 RepID=A0ACC0X6X4_9ROSI|nr:hypothetical protein Pint_33699 [Pistacia integerrima]